MYRSRERRRRDGRVAAGARAAAVAIVSNVPATVREVVAAAATTYRKAQKDRAARFEAIQSLRLRDVATRADHEARSSLLQSENEGLREQLALASDAIRTGADELKMLFHGQRVEFEPRPNLRAAQNSNASPTNGSSLYRTWTTS